MHMRACGRYLTSGDRADKGMIDLSTYNRAAKDIYLLSAKLTITSG
jgi:hypothetical protein